MEQKTDGPQPPDGGPGAATLKARADLGIMREKYWDEYTPEQKISRLGDVVESLNRRLVEQEDLISILRQHEHGSRGDIVVPIGRKETGGHDRSYIERNPLNRERVRGY